MKRKRKESTSHGAVLSVFVLLKLYGLLMPVIAYCRRLPVWRYNSETTLF